jgi:hypothetical protein
VLKTKKIRLYIEDQIIPYPARKVRMVVDFITDENILKFPVEKGGIEDLTIFGVNRDWEIPFLQEEKYLIINLGDLNQWIGVKDEEGLKPVKLDLKFIMIEPVFQISSLDLGYSGLFESSGAEDIELHLILPLGMKMNRHGKNPEIRFIKKGGSGKIISIPASGMLETNRKRRYDFLLSKNHFKNIYRDLGSPENIEIQYDAVNESRYFLLSFIGFGLLFLALFRLTKLILGGELEFDIRYLAALVGFIGLFLTILRENYEIPFRKLVMFSTIFLAVELIIELIFLK